MPHAYVYAQGNMFLIKKTQDFKVPLFLKYLQFLFTKHFKTISRLFNYESKQSQICHRIFTTGELYQSLNPD